MKCAIPIHRQQTVMLCSEGTITLPRFLFPWHYDLNNFTWTVRTV